MTVLLHVGTEAPNVCVNWEVTSQVRCLLVGAGTGEGHELPWA